MLFQEQSYSLGSDNRAAFSPIIITISKPTVRLTLIRCSGSGEQIAVASVPLRYALCHQRSGRCQLWLLS